MMLFMVYGVPPKTHRDFLAKDFVRWAGSFPSMEQVLLTRQGLLKDGWTKIKSYGPQNVEVEFLDDPPVVEADVVYDSPS